MIRKIPVLALKSDLELNKCDERLGFAYRAITCDVSVRIDLYSDHDFESNVRGF